MTSIDPERNNGKPWSDEDRELLRKLYPHDSNANLARIFGRSHAGINNAAVKLRLFKSPEYMATKPGQFSRGDTAWNKGMKGWQPGGASKASQFRPGNVNHNWKPIGHEMEISGYLYRKIKEGGTQHQNYRPIHHLTWVESRGPIPDGHIVAFKDGNARNCDINNLELITRAENMRRNSHHTHLPPELCQIVQLRGQLTRKINNRRRQNAEQDH